MGDFRYTHGCLMVNPSSRQGWVEWLHRTIDPDDIYDAPGFGLETEPHVTIAFGFHSHVRMEDVVPFIDRTNFAVRMRVTGISSFKASGDKEYDVLKLTIESEQASALNSVLTNSLDYNPPAYEYTPHLTIAYLKKGMSDKYERQFSRSYNLVFDLLTYTYPSPDGAHARKQFWYPAGNDGIQSGEPSDA